MREHYLRDDIYCGAPSCKTCDTSAARLSTSASTISIVDTNVVLNQVAVDISRGPWSFYALSWLYLVDLMGIMQIDLLESPAIDDVVVLSVVLEEVRNKNLAVYNRLKALCTNSLRKYFVFSNEHHK